MDNPRSTRNSEDEHVFLVNVVKEVERDISDKVDIRTPRGKKCSLKHIYHMCKTSLFPRDTLEIRSKVVLRRGRPDLVFVLSFVRCL